MTTKRKKTKNDDVALRRFGLPERTTVDIDGDTLTLTRSWFNSGLFGYLFFGVFWNAMLLFMFFGDGELSLVFLCLPHVWIGVWVAVQVVLGFVNSTKVQVNPTSLSIIHGPIPTFNNKSMPVTQIQQFYVMEKEHKHKNSTSKTYEIFLRRSYGRDERVLKGIEIPQQALHLEQVLEDFLGIKDQPISGEFKLRQNRRKQVQVDADWTTLAELNDLRVTNDIGSGELTLSGKFRGYDLYLRGASTGNDQDVKYRTVFQLGAGYLKSSEDKKDEPAITVDEIEARFDGRGNGPYTLKAKLKLQVWGVSHLRYEYAGLETDVDYLQFLFDLSTDLMDAYPRIIKLGGEAVSTLLPISQDKKHRLQSIAQQLLHEIQEKTQALAPETSVLVCQRCFHRVTKHEISINWMKSQHFYGCRACQQSNDFFRQAMVIAFLDVDMIEKAINTSQGLNVNWLIDRALFDFDAVAIANASDKDVEQFAMQIGNETDTLRKSKFAKMQCIIGPQCELSGNSLRILEKTFGEVKRR